MAPNCTDCILGVSKKPDPSFYYYYMIRNKTVFKRNGVRETGLLKEQLTIA